MSIPAGGGARTHVCTPRFTLLPALALLFLAALRPPPATGHAIVIRRNDVAGVWRFSSEVSFLSPPSPGDAARSWEEEAFMVLSADGSFAPCMDDVHKREREVNASGGDEPFVLGGARRGLWHFDPKKGEMTLVPNRRAGADGRRVHDVFLRGTVGATAAVGAGDGEDAFLNIAAGIVAVGRCMYPRAHPNFFDEPGPVHRSTTVGKFRMAQVLGSLNTDLRSKGDDEEYDGGGNDVDHVEVETAGSSISIYRDEDFFGRQFLLTVESLCPKYRGSEGHDAAAPLDVRVLPVEFHVNRTFTAQGVNKILRGRFRVKGKGSKYELEMQVSLFGAGRSAPGSVYSEGKGLSHEDQRYYSGRILATKDNRGHRILFVRGSVVFGTDLGSDARPEPVGSFSMMEVRNWEHDDPTTRSITCDDKDA